MKCTRTSFSPWACGVRATYISLDKIYELPLPCKQWSCEKCCKRKIKELRKNITRAMNMLGGVHLFIATLNCTHKERSNFIQRKVKGLYVCIGTESSTVIICTKKFPGARRKYKEKYLENDLRKVLESPWKEGRRISSSSEISNLWKYFELIDKDDSEKNGLALVLGEHLCEFSKLKTDEEKAIWLAEHRDSARIFEKGEQFIEKNTS